MTININEIYKKNILYKYDYRNRDEFEKAYNSKERHMWNFTLALLKDMPDRHFYDNENKKDIADLEMNRELFFDWCPPNDFTIEDWFNYLKNK